MRETGLDNVCGNVACTSAALNSGHTVLDGVKNGAGWDEVDIPRVRMPYRLKLPRDLFYFCIYYSYLAKHADESI